MLDHFSSQASGLIGLGCHPGARLVTLVNHGDESAELPLLWHLCLALVNLGYSVTVLDASTTESEANPGLQQLLDDGHWETENQSTTPAWTVLASARGVQRLLDGSWGSHEILQPLCAVLPTETVVVLYCKVDWLVRLVGDRSTEPVLAVSSSKSSLLTGYTALKRLLITDQLKPTIVNMLQDPHPFASAQQSPTAAGLSECARRFLGQDLKLFDIADPPSGAGPCQAVQRLALRMLESSLPLVADQRRLVNMRRAPSGGYSPQFVGSH